MSVLLCVDDEWPNVLPKLLSSRVSLLEVRCIAFFLIALSDLAVFLLLYSLMTLSGWIAPGEVEAV